MENQEKLIQLTLTESQVNTVLIGVANLPYKEVAPIITIIFKQANQQQTNKPEEVNKLETEQS